ncbi:MAG: MAPEG family protein [Rhizobiaceae bacterium]
MIRAEVSAIIPWLSVEMAYLALSVLLLLVHLSVQSFTYKAQVGNRYTVGARDDDLPPTGMAGRAARAYRNFLETFPAFAALALAIEVTGSHDGYAGLGAALYFWCRVAYLPAYMAGLVWVRTLIWNASAVGLVIMLWRLAF